jgi:hypothetical protein
MSSPRQRRGELPPSSRLGLLMPGSPRRPPVRFLVFSASLRRDSLNTRLAELATAAIEAGGGDVDVAAMSDFDAPSYDQDVQREEGFPPGAEEFRRRLEACHGFVVASPEYVSWWPHRSTTHRCLGRKRAWVEYLGEHPEPALDRVE